KPRPPDLNIAQPVTVQLLLQQPQLLPRILVVDEPEVYLQHRTPRQHSLRALADISGLEAADSTRRLHHVTPQRLPVTLRLQETLDTPLLEQVLAPKRNLLQQTRLGRRETFHVIVPALDENLVILDFDRGHCADQPPGRI